VLLVDEKQGTTENVQANATQARTMEHFRRLGFADEIRALGLPPDFPTDVAYFTRFAMRWKCVLGFVPAFTPDGNLLGVFPVNAVHNLVHVGLGVWGVLAGASLAASLIYFRGIAILYGLLAVLGWIPATSTLFGLAPIHGADVVLHAVLALVAAYLGFWFASKPGRAVPGT
jgi:hypothetical protein